MRELHACCLYHLQHELCALRLSGAVLGHPLRLISLRDAEGKQERRVSLHPMAFHHIPGQAGGPTLTPAADDQGDSEALLHTHLLPPLE